MAIFSAGYHPFENNTFKQVLGLARRAGCQLFLVGGYLRDALLNRLDKSSFADLDFVVCGGQGINLAQSVACELSGRFVLLDSKNDTARVVFQDRYYFDFAGCVGETLEADIKRRDFTINAIAWDPGYPEKLIDYVGGIEDLNKGLVRVVAEKNFTDDPLRLLRSYRFASVLNFVIENDTARLIARHAALIKEVAPERVSYELFTLFDQDRAADTLKEMGESGLLEEIFPELRPCRNVTANLFHHLGLFDHALETVRQAEEAVLEFPDSLRFNWQELLTNACHRLAAIKLACLLHDIGKPDTWVITESGKHTFIGHDKLGAQLCQSLARRLRWPKSAEKFIEKLVRWHLRPGQLFNQGEPTDKAVYRFYRTIGDEVPDLLLLALADFRSTCGPGLQAGRKQAEQKLFELLKRYFVYKEKMEKLPRLLDGNEVMDILGIDSGPTIGKLLEALAEAQSLNQIATYGQAKDFVKLLYREKYCQ